MRAGCLIEQEDAVQLGLETFLVMDGCRGVNVHPGDVDRAIEEMKRNGVVIVASGELEEG